jgi:uncharacterized protein (DUF2267 family)
MSNTDAIIDEETLRRTLLTERLATVGTLAEGLAHEVQNPLNCALLQLAVLQRRLEQAECQPSTLQPVAELVEQALRRLELLFNDFVSLLQPRSTAGSALASPSVTKGSTMNIFETVNAEARVWMRAVMSEGGTTDAETSLKVMAEGLRAIRERLTVEEAAQLGAHLPLLVRGIFFEAWDPGAHGAQSKTEVLGMLGRRCSGGESATSADVASVLFRVVKARMMSADARELSWDDLAWDSL